MNDREEIRQSVASINSLLYQNVDDDGGYPSFNPTSSAFGDPSENANNSNQIYSQDLVGPNNYSRNRTNNRNRYYNNHDQTAAMHNTGDPSSSSLLIISDPVTRTVIAHISHSVGVGVLVLAFACHNASIAVLLFLLVLFYFLSVLSDYILVVACEHTKQFSQQSLLSYCLLGSPENMFDTPIVSRAIYKNRSNKNNKKNKKKKSSSNKNNKKKGGKGIIARITGGGVAASSSAVPSTKASSTFSKIPKTMGAFRENYPDDDGPSTTTLATTTTTASSATSNSKRRNNPNQQQQQQQQQQQNHNDSEDDDDDEEFSSDEDEDEDDDDDVMFASPKNRDNNGRNDTNNDDDFDDEEANRRRMTNGSDFLLSPSSGIANNNNNGTSGYGSITNLISSTNNNNKKKNNNNNNSNGLVNAASHDDDLLDLHQQQQQFGHSRASRSIIKKYHRAVMDVNYYRKATLVVSDIIILVGSLCLLVAYSRVIATCCSSVCHKFGCYSEWTLDEASSPWYIVWGVFFFLFLSWKRILFEPPMITLIKTCCIVFLVLCMIIQYAKVYYLDNLNNDSNNGGNNNTNTSPNDSSSSTMPKEIRYFGFYSESLSSLATLALSCSYHSQTPQLYSAIVPRNPAIKMKAAWISNLMTTLFFIVAALIPYLSFGDRVSLNRRSQKDGGGNILDQYNVDNDLFTAVRLIVILHFAIAFPILGVQVRESLHRLGLVVLGESSGVRDMSDVLRTSRIAIVVESLILVTFVQLIGAVVPGIGIVINVGGSVSSSYTFLILPAIVGINVFAEVDPAEVGDFSNNYSSHHRSRRRTTMIMAGGGAPNPDDIEFTDSQSIISGVTTNYSTTAGDNNNSTQKNKNSGILTSNNNNNKQGEVEHETGVLGYGNNHHNHRHRGDEDSETLNGDDGQSTRYADSVLRSSTRNDFTGFFGKRISAHSMRYICYFMLVFGVCVCVGGVVSSFLNL